MGTSMRLAVLFLVCALHFSEGFNRQKRSLLDNLLKKFFNDEKVEKVRTNRDPNLKQLIITSMPGGNHQKYNAEQLGEDWNWKFQYFLFTYAMAAKRIGDEFMIFYPQGMVDSGLFDPSIFACSDALLLPMNPGSEMDIWMRDFTAINPEDPLHFNYRPWYLGADGPVLGAEFLQGMHDYGALADPPMDNSSGLLRHDTRLALDGGNVVDCEDKAIVSLRVLDENPGMTEAQVRVIIEQALPDRKICFIRNPPKEEDTTGHSDGVCSFLNKDTLILPIYNEYDDTDYNVRYKNISDCFPASEFPDFKIHRMNNYLPENSKRRELEGLLKRMLADESGTLHKRRSKRATVGRFTSATGSTVNLAATDYGLYVPVFESIDKDNSEQFNLIDSLKGNKHMEGVDTGYISKMGGSVRCLSWQQYANSEVAKKLLNNGRVWQPRSDPHYNWPRTYGYCGMKDFNLYDEFMYEHDRPNWYNDWYWDHVSDY